MSYRISHPRLHMGCGESLHSQLLLDVAQPEYKSPSMVSRKPSSVKRKRERMCR